MTISPPPLHEALVQSASALKVQRVEHLFNTTPDRATHYRCQGAGVTLDFSKHLLDDNAWSTLLELGRLRALPDAFTSLISGDMINSSEKRPALHTLLRGTARERQSEISAAVEETLTRMALLVERIHSG